MPVAFRSRRRGDLHVVGEVLVGDLLLRREGELVTLGREEAFGGAEPRREDAPSPLGGLTELDHVVDDGHRDGQSVRHDLRAEAVLGGDDLRDVVEGLVALVDLTPVHGALLRVRGAREDRGPVRARGVDLVVLTAAEDLEVVEDGPLALDAGDADTILHRSHQQEVARTLRRDIGERLEPLDQHVELGGIVATQLGTTGDDADVLGGVDTAQNELAALLLGKLGLHRRRLRGRHVEDLRVDILVHEGDGGDDLGRAPGEELRDLPDRSLDVDEAAVLPDLVLFRH